MNKMNKKIVEKVSRQVARRAEKCKDKLVVYTYRQKEDGSLSDNLICLPLADKDAHKAYLERHLAEAISDSVKSWIKGFDLVSIGVFDKRVLAFKKSSVKTVVDFADLVARLELIKDEKDEK